MNRCTFVAEVSLEPGIGQAADIRDLTAAWNAGRTEGWNIKTSVGVAMAGLAFVPLLGDVAKAGVKPLFGKPASAVAGVITKTDTNATRLGITRNNPADWRATKDLWDQLGYVGILVMQIDPPSLAGELHLLIKPGFVTFQKTLVY